MLYIMRHGRTDWNAIHKLQGRSDIPLNDEGRKMAGAAATEYKDVHFDVCYCSPLKRARETAEILLSGRDVPIIFDDRLVEMGFGEYEGSREVLHTPGCEIAVVFLDPASYKESIKGSETFDELYARTGEFLEEVVYPGLKEGKDILIVGHGAMNSCIYCQINNIPRSGFWDEGIEQCKLKKLL